MAEFVFSQLNRDHYYDDAVNFAIDSQYEKDFIDKYAIFAFQKTDEKRAHYKLIQTGGFESSSFEETDEIVLRSLDGNEIKRQISRRVLNMMASYENCRVLIEHRDDQCWNFTSSAITGSLDRRSERTLHEKFVKELRRKHNYTKHDKNDPLGTAVAIVGDRYHINTEGQYHSIVKMVLHSFILASNDGDLLYASKNCSKFPLVLHSGESSEMLYKNRFSKSKNSPILALKNQNELLDKVNAEVFNSGGVYQNAR
ncbi:MAG: hypothetical protein LBM09_01210 [Candidatus Nomurabacteria bacterium]|jgi:hypothetical protein|nr:hypothetical protein [Candidatus Nomurabacteria bacterium]